MEAACWEGYLVIPPSQVEAACTEGFDGMSELVARVPLNPNPNPNPKPNPNQALREMVGKLQVAHNFAADAATEELAAGVTAGMAALDSGGGSGQQAAAVVSSFVCPITQAVMEDPVMTADGHTYERAAIEQWLASHNTSPLTGLPLSTHELVPNEQLARHIQAAAAQ